VILLTADITGYENRRLALREAHRAKREFGRVVAEELPRALLAEASFRVSRDPSRGIRGALSGGKGGIHETTERQTEIAVAVGIEYDDVPWWRVQNRPLTVIRAKNVRNLTIPLTDEAALALYRYGGARNIPGLVFAKIGGLPYLVKEGTSTPFIRLKPSVTIKGIQYVEKGLDRFKRSAWRRLIETLPPLMTN
jgi:hypothetical protein